MDCVKVEFGQVIVGSGHNCKINTVAQLCSCLLSRREKPFYNYTGGSGFFTIWPLKMSNVYPILYLKPILKMSPLYLQLFLTIYFYFIGNDFTILDFKSVFDAKMSAYWRFFIRRGTVCCEHSQCKIHNCVGTIFCKISYSLKKMILQ